MGAWTLERTSELSMHNLDIEIYQIDIVWVNIVESTIQNAK